ncbi:cation:proton antiporter [Mumia zhuanghuii]|nr:cation:proton antiporter [Mumia zhuanghuii]
MTAVAWTAGGMLGIAALLCVVRAAIGPSMPNRAVAIDVLVAVLVGGLGVEAAYNRHTDTLPILVVLSLVGVVGSVSIARFATGDEPDESDEADQADRADSGGGGFAGGAEQPQ